MSSTEQYQAPPNGFRTFVIVWITQSVSVFGSALTWFAVTIWLTQVLYPKPEQKPQLAFALTLIGLTYAVTLLFAPIAGAWADRHDRKRTMMAVDFASGCLSLVIMTLMLTHLLEFWSLLIILVIFGALSPFHASAFDTSYAMIVPEKQLPRANGMMQTIWSLSGILSPAIAATIIALPSLARQGTLPSAFNNLLSGLTDGSALAIGVDAVTFFIASATLIFLNIPSPKRTDLHADGTKKKTSVWADIKEGALYIKRRPPLLWLLATFTVINFASAPIQVFVPLLLKFNLASDWQSNGFTFETALAVISTAGGIGGVVGGVLISAWGGLKKKRVYGVVVPILIAGIVEIMFGLSSLLILTAVASFLVDALVPFMNAHSQTIWQTQVPRHLQGRVFSVRRVIAQFTAPLGIMIAGIAGTGLNPGLILVVLGALIVAFSIGQLFNPFLLRVEDKTYLDQLAIQRGEPAENLLEPPAEPIHHVSPLPTPITES
jgi:DHA3 family macrolide efflux protein-like MFS transporter